jgi:hypothetical protein
MLDHMYHGPEIMVSRVRTVGMYISPDQMKVAGPGQSAVYTVSRVPSSAAFSDAWEDRTTVARLVATTAALCTVLSRSLVRERSSLLATTGLELLPLHRRLAGGYSHTPST